MPAQHSGEKQANQKRLEEEDEGEDPLPEPMLHNGEGEEKEDGVDNPNLTARQRRMKGAIHRSLNLSCALATRRVTMIVCNVVGFHQSLKRYGPERLHILHSNMVERMVTLAKENRGIVDYIIGDHSYVSFNASYSCRQHCTHAALFALELERMFQRDDELKPLGGLRMGIASGTAVCGHFGSESMKQFSIIGTVVHHAFALMHQCKSDGVSSLMNAAAFDIMHHRFWVLHWNYVLLPQSTNPALISTLKGKRPGLRLASRMKGTTFNSDKEVRFRGRTSSPIPNPLENHGESRPTDGEELPDERGAQGTDEQATAEESTDDLNPEDSRVLTIVNEAFSICDG